MRRTGVIAAAAFGIVSITALVAIRHDHRQKIARHDHYSEIAASFRKDLAPGTTRDDVAKYLQSRHLQFSPISFGSSRWSYAAKIEDFDTFDFPCNEWTEYVIFD